MATPDLFAHISRALDAIQATLRPWLAERGFHEHGRTFNRMTEDGLTHVLNFRPGPLQDPREPLGFCIQQHIQQWFTVNMGVHIPEVALHHPRGAAEWVEHRCAIRVMHGLVDGAGRGEWWPAEATVEVIESVHEFLRLDGLPWLSRFADRRHVLRELREPAAERWCAPRIVMAIVQAARGEADAARSLLMAQVSDPTTSQALVDHARELAVQLGLGNLDD